MSTRISVPRVGSVSIFACLALFCLGSLGCKPAANPMVDATRARVISSVQPSDPASLVSTYENFKGDDEEVTVVGRIFALGMDAFDRESATFNLTELPEPGHNHDDPGDCPFCKRKLENAATALVQIVDDSGEAISQPADGLLGLEKNQDVVVSGTATKVGDLMIITANSIHVLSEEAAKELATMVAAEFEDSDEELESIPEPPGPVPPSGDLADELETAPVPPGLVPPASDSGADAASE